MPRILVGILPNNLSSRLIVGMGMSSRSRVGTNIQINTVGGNDPAKHARQMLRGAICERIQDEIVPNSRDRPDLRRFLASFHGRILGSHPRRHGQNRAEYALKTLGRDTPGHPQSRGRDHMSILTTRFACAANGGTFVSKKRNIRLAFFPQP